MAKGVLLAVSSLLNYSLMYFLCIHAWGWSPGVLHYGEAYGVFYSFFVNDD